MSSTEETEQARRARLIAAARQKHAAAQKRIQGTWIQDIIDRLKVADMASATALFASSLMLSVLPLIIVLSSIADQRVDDDISRHIGLNHEGAAVVNGLFRARPAHDSGTVAIALAIGLAGMLTTVQFLQEIYERIFGLEKRGWRHLWRFFVWTTVLMLMLLTESLWAPAVRDNGGPIAEAAIAMVALTSFFTWTMYYLLGGRLPWRRFVRPGVVTALMWIGLAFASSFLFSSTVVSDSKLYGTIGVVFDLLTWFIAISAIIVLGAVIGAVWDERHNVRPSRD